MEIIKLNTIPIDGKVEGEYLLSRIELKTTKTGSPYLDIDISDYTTNMNMKIWDGTVCKYTEGEYLPVTLTLSEFYEKIKENKGLGIKGIKVIDSYSKKNSINVKQLYNVSPTFNENDYVAASERDLDEMLVELKSYIQSMGQGDTTYLQMLLNNILFNKVEIFEMYKTFPAAKTVHHAYKHGLLEHTLEVLKIVDLMCDIYEEKVDRNMLIAAAILHDFAKIYEFESVLDKNYTDTGKLIGHIPMCVMIINDATNKIEGFPNNLGIHLIHLILSHHGKYEYQSPVLPKTIEAIILHYADELSSKANAYLSAIERDDDVEATWTKREFTLNTDVCKSFLNKKERLDIGGEDVD